MSLTLTLPVPPSANVLWRTVNGRQVKSKAARDYQAAVLAVAIRQRVKCIPAPHHVAVTVRWYRARRAGDLDNRLKAALDALRGIAFTDDSQVVDIRASRYDDPTNPRLVIVIEEAA